MAGRIGVPTVVAFPASEGSRSSTPGSDVAIKGMLLDQSFLAGVGNIYADEALHAAGINPQRRGSTLTPEEIDRL